MNTIIDTSKLSKEELLEITKALETYGADIGTMLEKLNIPQDFKEAMATLVLSLTPEQLDNLYETLYQRCIEQETADLVLDEDAEYQVELAGLEAKLLADLQKVTE